MAWNQPGNNGRDRDPWGSSKPGDSPEGSGSEGGREQGPPDSDDTLRKLSKKLGGLSSDEGTGSGGDSLSQDPCPQSGGQVFTIVMAAIVIIQAASGFYTIKEAKHDVVTRFDKFSHLAESGLNWKSTFVNEVTPVNVEAMCELAVSGVMLISDENVVHIEMDVRYHVTDPQRYLSSITSANDSLRQITGSAPRGVIGKYIMDCVLTERRIVIYSDIQRELEETIRPYNMGTTLLGVNLQTARPPEEVKAASDDAIATRENEQQCIREAEACANEVQPRTNSQAQRILEEAYAHKTQTILEAQGEVARFAKVLPGYKVIPQITRGRLYIETMERVLSNVHKVLVNDKDSDPMVLPPDQMLKGGSAPTTRTDSSLDPLRPLPATTSSTGVSNTSSASQGDIMD